ncbi:MAG: hypothetical protein ICV66_03580 [Chitinophagaceae bacterium]|nr:hypothetical protein [Chitinophagaceae bacterium]
MLTEQEKAFIAYWSENRLKKKKSLRQFSLGFPLSVLVVAILFVNIISGWHREALRILKNNASLILVILIASVSTVVFVTIFSNKHKWEQNEQRYKELLIKQSKGQ